MAVSWLAAAASAQCYQANMTCSRGFQIGNLNTFAVHCRDLTTRTLTGITLRCRPLGSALGSGVIELWLADPRGKPLQRVASGTITIGPGYGNHSGRFTKPYVMPAGRDYAAVWALRNSTHPICATGQQRTHWWHRPGSTTWSGPWSGYAWAFRVDCAPAGQGRYDPYGVGCKGSGNSNCNGGVPNLLATGVPRIGKLMLIHMQCGRPNARYLLLFGMSDSYYRGLRLPFNLGILGAPSCNILASPDVTVSGTVTPHGLANIPLTPPSDPRLVGQRFYNQFLVFDPGAPGGIALSNGRRAVIGT